MLKLLLSVFLLATPAFSSTLNVDKNRLIRLNGAVDGKIIEHANTLHALSLKNNKPVYLMINSPGGQVVPGKIFISAMKQAQGKGIKIHCFSTVYAASMAFTILLNCDERYVMESTLLLYHPVRIMTGFGAVLLARDMLRLGMELAREDYLLLEFLKEKLVGLDPVSVTNTFYNEKAWEARELIEQTEGVFTLVTDINNVPDLYQYSQDGYNNQEVDSFTDFIISNR